MVQRACLALAALGGLWLGPGCGQPPVPVDPRTGDVLDPRHRPSSVPQQVSGTIRLRGKLAEADTGTLFVFLRERGSRVPARMRSYVYGGVEISDPKDGERVLQFSVTDRDVLPGMDSPLPQVPELRALYSPTGSVGGDGAPIAKEVPVRYGDDRIEIVLP